VNARLRGEAVPARHEFQAIRQDGQVIWIEMLDTVVPWDGKPAVLAAFFDITERKELEAHYRQAQGLESIGSLAAGIAHDFNNLMTIIAGRSQLASWHLDRTSPLRQHLGLIEQTVQRAVGLPGRTPS